jgi:hypothetical protein
MTARIAQLELSGKQKEVDYIDGLPSGKGGARKLFSQNSMQFRAF